MSRFKLVALLAFLLSFSSPAGAVEELKYSYSISTENESQADSFVNLDYQPVYICTGAYSYAYHSRSDCPGLGNCSGSIRYTEETSASQSLGRVPCCRCWTNVVGRCKDDNPNYGRGGSSSGGESAESYLYIAAAIAAASLIILSNDICLYPIYSFHFPSDYKSYYSAEPKYAIGKGFILGLRKTFKASALELHWSALNSNLYFEDNKGQIYQDSYFRSGGHLNYVHWIFKDKTPDWMKIYLGPSLNYIEKPGFGGIIGSEMKLGNRIKFDVRYELTSQSNQLQAGFIFTYQKKYFWQ